MLGQVFSAYLHGRSLIAVAVSPGEWRTLSFAELKKAYRASPNLRALSEILGVDARATRKALGIAGIDYVRDMYKSYLKGRSCLQIANESGMKRSTLSALFANRGWPPRKGRSRRKYSQYQLMLVGMSLKTINAAAKELGVHWQTAKSLYQRLGYLKRLNGRHQIEVEFKLSKGTALCLEV